MHDLIIRGAAVADGLGNPLIEADVAVGSGRIVAIGDIPEGAAETVDAAGRVLCPGIVDLHTHYDAQLTWDRTASPSPARSEEHTSELQSLMRTSYAVFCLKKNTHH